MPEPRMTQTDWKIINVALAEYQATDHDKDGGYRRHSDAAVARTRSKVHERLDEGETSIEAALTKLLADWFQGELNHISEHSGDMYNDWQAAIDDAKARHEALGVPWHNTFVPDYVREMLAMEEEG
jgi:hypothetical protein